MTKKKKKVKKKKKKGFSILFFVKCKGDKPFFFWPKGYQGNVLYQLAIYSTSIETKCNPQNDLLVFQSKISDAGGKTWYIMEWNLGKIWEGEHV